MSEVKHSEQHMWSVPESDGLHVVEPGWHGGRSVLVYHVSLNLADGKPWQLITVGYPIEPGYGATNQIDRQEWPLDQIPTQLAAWLADHGFLLAGWWERQSRTDDC